MWRWVLQQYHPTFLGQCVKAIEWTNSFVTRQLETVMFEGDPEAARKAAAVVEALSDSDVHKSHERHISAETCERIGLKVLRLESDARLQDLTLTVHHCFMHSLMNTPAFKIY